MTSIERPTESAIGAEGLRYLLAQAAGQRVAFPLEVVREIIPPQAMTRLPGAGAWVLGLLNLRGLVLTVVDLTVRFGGEVGESPSIVVVEVDGRTFGVQVEKVSAVSNTRSGAEAPVDEARSAEGLVEFPDRLGLLLSEHGVEGSRLALELTETAAMSDETKATDILVRLRVKHIDLAIDDFGTGYSSLQQLYKLPFTELKIDRSFVAELPGSSEARAIVHATIVLAHTLGMTVCAEGVETQAALDYL